MDDIHLWLLFQRQPCVTIMDWLALSIRRVLSAAQPQQKKTTKNKERHEFKRSHNAFYHGNRENHDDNNSQRAPTKVVEKSNSSYIKQQNKMAKWFRSEPMEYISIIMNEDAAHDCLSDLGNLGAIQFTDVSKQPCFFA